MERTNCSTVKPTPAEAESSQGATALICGAKLLTTAVRSLDAKLHKLFNDAPMIGQVSTLAGGGGTVRVPSLTWAPRVWTPSTSVSASKAIGRINKPRSTTLNKMADNTPRPPNASCNFWKLG